MAIFNSFLYVYQKALIWHLSLHIWTAYISGLGMIDLPRIAKPYRTCWYNVFLQV